MDGGPIGVEGVVEVQHVCGDAVGQRRLPGRSCAREFRRCLRHVTRRRVHRTRSRRGPGSPPCVDGAGDGAAEPVDEATHGLVPDILGKVLGPYTGSEGRQRAAHRVIDRSPTGLPSVIRKEILLYRLHGTNSGSYDDRTSVETRTLLDFVCHTRLPTDIPTDVLHESTRCLLDHVGLAVRGRSRARRAE